MFKIYANCSSPDDNLDRGVDLLGKLLTVGHPPKNGKTVNHISSKICYFSIKKISCNLL